MRPIPLMVMMYHYIRDPGDHAECNSGIPGMPVSHFVAQLDYLMANYELIAWPDLRDHLTVNRSLPARACLLTFDDGVRDHYLNVFPALRSRRLSGLFFALARQPDEGLTLGHKIHFLIARLGFNGLREGLYDRLDPVQRKGFARIEARYRSLQHPTSLSGEIEVFKLVLQRDLAETTEPILSQLIEEHLGLEVEIASEFFLNQDQILEMSAGGMHFGGHSQSHPWFDWVDDHRQAEEIIASGRWLSTFEQGPWAFAFPYGGWNTQSPTLLQENGFIAAFTTRAQAIHPDPFQIGRYDADSFSNEMISGNLSGGNG